MSMKNMSSQNISREEALRIVSDILLDAEMERYGVQEVISPQIISDVEMTTSSWKRIWYHKTYKRNKHGK